MMSAHCTEDFHSISNPKLCLVCRNSNSKQPSPEPQTSSDPDKDSDQFLRIFYQCINVQPPIKFDQPTTTPEFCTSCKEYLEEWDNIAMQVALLITRAKRIENTLTSRVLIASKSPPETGQPDDEYFRGHLAKKYNPVVRLEKIQPTPSIEASTEPENSQPLASEVSIISPEDESDELQDTGPTRRSKRLKKSRKISLKMIQKRKPDLRKDGYPNFNCNSVEKVGPGEYKFNGRIPFKFKDGIFSCGCCFQNYEGPLGHAKSRMLTHVTKFHSDDLPDWLDQAGLDATQVKFLQLGIYIFLERVPFSVRRSAAQGRRVSFKCELCPRAVSGPLKHCWSEFTKHMTLTHMSGSAVIDPEPSDKDGQEEEKSSHTNNIEIEKVFKEEQEDQDSQENNLFVPEINIQEFGQASQVEHLDAIVARDLSAVLATGEDRYLCQLCNVIFLNRTELETHIDLVHSDVFKSEIDSGFEPMITQEDLLNEGENIEDMKIDPLEIIGP